MNRLAEIRIVPCQILEIPRLQYQQAAIRDRHGLKDGFLVEIRWAWLPVLLAGSLLGGYLGAHLAIKKGNRWIKRAFELITLLIGIKLIWG